jgi:hypothetical protein
VPGGLPAGLLLVACAVVGSLSELLPCCSPSPGLLGSMNSTSWSLAILSSFPTFLHQYFNFRSPSIFHILRLQASDAALRLKTDVL